MSADNEMDGTAMGITFAASDLPYTSTDLSRAMTEHHDNVFSLSERRRQLSQQGTLTDKTAGRGPGHVRHDARGNAIWNWDVATGVLARSKAGELLQMLHNPGLQIAQESEPAASWAGDPYNRS